MKISGQIKVLFSCFLQ